MIPKSLKRGEESTSTPPPGCLVEIFGSCRHEWDRGFESGLLQRRVVRTPVPTSKRPAFTGEDKSPTPLYRGAHKLRFAGCSSSVRRCGGQHRHGHVASGNRSRRWSRVDRPSREAPAERRPPAPNGCAGSRSKWRSDKARMAFLEEKGCVSWDISAAPRRSGREYYGNEPK